MSKFKAGDEIVIVKKTRGYVGNLKVGDTAVVDELYFNPISKVKTSARMLCDKNKECCFHLLENIELLKPKWTIYNNTLQWSELSDKQKGKMLLARYRENLFTSNHTAYAGYADFSCSETIYKAVEPVKPEPTMAELFDADANSFDFRRSFDFPEFMITKGWVKK